MSRSLRRLDAGDMTSARARPRRGGTVAVVLLALIGAGAMLTWAGLGPAAGRQQPAASTTGTIIDAPRHTKLKSTARLLAAPTHVPQSTDYALIDPAGRPATWEPCRAIHYVVHSGEEPPQFDRLLKEAIAEVSRDTGLQFVDDGPTPEIPLNDPRQRPAYEPRTYGDRWAPVLVAWSNSAETAELSGTEAGFAGPRPWAPAGGPPRYVSGVVSFNVSDLNYLWARPHGETLVRDVLLHELGHLVGLGHVNVPGEIMYPTLTHPIQDFGPGDLAGLARLGEGRCFRDY